nr:hypothetical protein [Marseillevirus cajuinensis]
MSKLCAYIYVLSAVPSYLLFCVEEGAKLKLSRQDVSPRVFASSLGFALFKGTLYPYYFYKYSKGEISFE